MDSHAITNFCAGLILKMEERNPTAGLTDRELNVLRAVRQECSTIGRKMRDSRHELSELEDKHMFIVGDMLRLARNIGFRECEYINAVTPECIGDDHHFRLIVVLKRYGVPEEKLKPYEFIFREFTETYGVAMGSAAPYNFGYFIMQK
jgi:hypothetical protein